MTSASLNTVKLMERRLRRHEHCYRSAMMPEEMNICKKKGRKQGGMRGQGSGLAAEQRPCSKKGFRCLPTWRHDPLDEGQSSSSSLCYPPDPEDTLQLMSQWIQPCVAYYHVLQRCWMVIPGGSGASVISSVLIFQLWSPNGNERGEQGQLA